MTRDLIVDKVHRIRQAMWDQAGGSLAELLASLRDSERRHARQLVTPQQVIALEQAKPPSRTKRPSAP